MVVILVVLLVIVVGVAVWFMSTYNGIIKMNNRCDNAWQTIDVQLQRRNDLIPNLVETVKGYASHESDTLMAVTKARTAVMGASTPEAKMEASDALTGSLRSLMAVSEAYPELKADGNFQQLQRELKDTEDRISYARMSFNDCVMKYNNAIETFPGNIVAGGKCQKRQGFEAATPEARDVPQVKF